MHCNKPVCPTRWTVRGKAITAVLSQYGSVLASLQEMTCGASHTASAANGLPGQFRKGKTVWGLLLDSPVICELERLNISFQKRTETIAGMRAAVHVVRTSLKRDEASFKALFEEATAVVQSVSVKSIIIPQTRTPPKHFIEGAEAHQVTQVRLLLVVPVSSSEAERSFSVLRRLKLGSGLQ